MSFYFSNLILQFAIVKTLMRFTEIALLLAMIGGRIMGF